MLGYSRDSFYRFRDRNDRGGELALAEMTKAKPNLKNRVAPEIEAAVVGAWPVDSADGLRPTSLPTGASTAEGPSIRFMVDIIVPVFPRINGYPEKPGAAHYCVSVGVEVCAENAQARLSWFGDFKDFGLPAPPRRSARDINGSK